MECFKISCHRVSFCESVSASCKNERILIVLSLSIIVPQPHSSRQCTAIVKSAATTRTVVVSFHLVRLLLMNFSDV